MDTLKKSKAILAASEVGLSFVLAIFSLWLLSARTRIFIPGSPSPVETGSYALGTIVLIALYWMVVACSMSLGLLAMMSGIAYTRIYLLALTTILTLAGCASAYFTSRHYLPQYFLPSFIIQTICLSAWPAFGILLAMRYLKAIQANAAAQPSEKAS